MREASQSDTIRTERRLEVLEVHGLFVFANIKKWKDWTDIWKEIERIGTIVLRELCRIGGSFLCAMCTVLC